LIFPSLDFKDDPLFRKPSLRLRPTTEVISFLNWFLYQTSILTKVKIPVMAWASAVGQETQQRLTRIAGRN